MGNNKLGPAAVTNANLNIVDTLGVSVNLGQINASGNYWRLQVGNATTAADGANGTVTVTLPIALASTANAYIVATVGALSGGSDYGYYVSHTTVVSTTQIVLRVTGVQVAVVTWFVWGQTAS